MGTIAGTVEAIFAQWKQTKLFNARKTVRQAGCSSDTRHSSSRVEQCRYINETDQVKGPDSYVPDALKMLG